MCGISGILNNQIYEDDLKLNITNMVNSLSHRGPDSNGIWIDNQIGLALGQTRLSIRDLSLAGSQPMHSLNERFVIVYNGEIYNLDYLHQRLNKNNINLETNNDTKALLECCNTFGINDTLNMIDGMYAFCLWDKKNHKLYLVRDRLGIKPLYWSRVQNSFFFSSEIKSFYSTNLWSQKLNLKFLNNYFKRSHCTSQESIFENTYQVKPGHYIEIDSSLAFKEKEYWKYIKRNVSNNSILNKDENINYLDKQLNKTIKNHLVSDVPTGAFLSGGIDSSLVVSIMQNNRIDKIKTFSIGFENKDYDETINSDAVAKFLKTDHNKIILNNKDVLNIVEDLPYIYDEPFADSSQIPTILVSQLASKYVKVSLSGDGGDEVFAGYNRYTFANKIKLFMNIFPFKSRIFVSKLLKILSVEQIDRIIKIFMLSNNYPQFGDKIYKLSNLISEKNFSSVYNRLITFWNEDDSLILDNSFVVKNNNFTILDNMDPIHQMQVFDLNNYLPNDILTKLDRASMSNSLEARVPLLDHNIVEHGLNLPIDLKISNGKTKWILREILKKYIPEKIIKKNKMGFGVPLHLWLRGPLKEWMIDTININELKKEGLLDYKKINNKMNEHLSEKNNWHHDLWNVLMFRAWQKRWKFR